MTCANLDVFTCKLNKSRCYWALDKKELKECVSYIEKEVKE